MATLFGSYEQQNNDSYLFKATLIDGEEKELDIPLSTSGARPGNENESNQKLNENIGELDAIGPGTSFCIQCDIININNIFSNIYLNNVNVNILEMADAIREGLIGEDEAIRGGLIGAADAIREGLIGEADAIREGLIGAVDAIREGLIGAAEAIRGGLIGEADAIRLKMEAEGYYCPLTRIQQFLCAYGTNQIILLHGEPGTGKTSFVEAFVKAMNEIYNADGDDEGKYIEKTIAVRPNWIDGQDLMGYYNPIEHRYYATPFLEALMKAVDNPDKQFIICLDEMNLAHIEYYFADILSAMETEEKELTLMSEEAWNSAKERFEKILKYYEDEEHTPETLDEEMRRLDAKNGCANLKSLKGGKLKIPANVQFVGTLNMDATTKDLSPKVINRSFIIEVTRARKDSEIITEAHTSEKIGYDTLFVYDGPEDNKEIKSIKDGAEDTAVNEVFELFNISNRIVKQIIAMGKNAGEKGISPAAFMDFVISCKLLPGVRKEGEEAGKFVQTCNESLEKVFSDVAGSIAAAQLDRMHSEDGNFEFLNYWKMRGDTK